MPRKRASAATVTADKMLAGPSAPAAWGPRMAPVTTTGRVPRTNRSSTKAVSSMVSVPCTTTAPSKSACKRWLSRSATSPKLRRLSDAPGMLNWVTASSVATSANCGTLSISLSAVRVGVMPPAPELVMVMVPPSDTIKMRGVVIWRCRVVGPRTSRGFLRPSTPARLRGSAHSRTAVRGSQCGVARR